VYPYSEIGIHWTETLLRHTTWIVVAVLVIDIYKTFMQTHVMFMS